MIRDKPETEFIAAINCLTKAEMLCEHEQITESGGTVQGEQTQPMNLSGERPKTESFHIKKLTPKISTLAGTESYDALQIISYLGLTEPKSL